jgi:K+-transporting ATPase ATPase A chain
MSPALAGFLQVGLLVLALAVCYRPLGNYIAHVVTTDKHWRAERRLYQLMGIDPAADQQWGTYLRSMLAFSAASVLVLYGMERLQHYLLLSLGMHGVPPALAWNTAASFTTNTNWQNYSGESTMGYLVQMSGLAVQNFLSAAVGIVIAIAMVRGFIRSRTGNLGNFWVDMTRITLRVLLPLSIVAGAHPGRWWRSGKLCLLPQHRHAGPWSSDHGRRPGGLAGGHQGHGQQRRRLLQRQLRHAVREPEPVHELVRDLPHPGDPFSLCRAFGRMVKDNRQGYALLAIMVIIWLVSVIGVSFFEAQHAGLAPQAAHAAMEAKEVRFGIPGSSLFATSTTVTSTGSVNSFHDSLYAVRWRDPALQHHARRGRAGRRGGGPVRHSRSRGHHGVCRRADGRPDPEYIGKKIRPTEMKYAALYMLTMPTIVLVFAALSLALLTPRLSILNPGPHGLTEIMYAFASMTNNNGSAFAGLLTNTDWYNTTGGIAMLLGRFVPEIFALGLAGSLARQQAVPASAGTMPTHKPLFVGMVIGVILIIVGLTFFPALALGPFAEGLH